MATEDVRRLLDLISFLRRHENTTEEEIAELLGVSTSDVQALLDRILMCGTPPYSPRDYVCVFREEGRVRVQFADHFRRPVNFSPAQAACLMVLLDDPMVGEDEHVLGVRERIKKKLAEVTPGGGGGGGGGGGAQAGGGGEPSIALAKPGSHVQRIAASLQEAIGAKRRVELEHFSVSRFALVRREVDPYRLLRLGDQLYLVGHDHTHREMIVRFRVDRINEVTLLEQAAAPADPQQLEQALAAEVRPTPAEHAEYEPETLVLRIEKELAPYVRETFEPSRVKTLPCGAVQVRMPIINEQWVLRFVLAYGEEAEILEPARMRSKLTQLIEQMLAQA